MINCPQHTKRLLTLALVVALVVASLALVACDDKPQAGALDGLTLPPMDDNQMALIIRNRDNTYTTHVVTLGVDGTDATTVEGVVSYLVGQGKLTVDWTDGGSGKWLNGIGGLMPDAGAHEYVAVYTSVEHDWSGMASATSYKIGGITVDYSQYGVSGMTARAGAVIYFELQTW